MAERGFAPPRNTDAERAVLTGVLTDHETAVEVFGMLSPEDFSDERHSLVYRACLSLDSRSVFIDLVTVAEELTRLKWLDQAGGMTYLAGLTEDISTVSGVRTHAAIVREKSMLRRLLAACQDGIRDVVEGSLTAPDIIDRAEKRVFEVGERMVAQDFEHISQLVKSGMEQLEKLHEAGSFLTGLSTGFESLDRMTTGLHPGELVIIAARPSVGKTTLALNMAVHMASQGGTVCFFSMEMAAGQLSQRILCAEAGIGMNAILTGQLTSGAWMDLAHALDRLSRLQIYINDSPGLTSLELRAKARHLRKRHGLSALFVDYLQLMRGLGGEENRQQEIARISGDMKALAKDLQVPVIALSQLSRRAVDRGGPPRLSDLRESGAIEQDADLVLFIHDEKFEEEVPAREYPDEKRISLVIGKQRNGPRGEIELVFETSKGRFTELSRYE